MEAIPAVNIRKKKKKSIFSEMYHMISLFFGIFKALKIQRENFSKKNSTL